MAHSIAMSRHQETLRRVRARANAPMESVVRRGGLAATGALVGYLESTGKLPIGFWANKAGEPMVPVKAALALGAHVGALMTAGTTSKVLSAVADAAAVMYGYDAGKTHAYVAGR